jgi:hypothetical protein
MSKNATTILYPPVGPEELDLIRKAGMRTFPPRLPEQPIFYPVLTESYAIEIARDWNVPASGVGYVTRFSVSSAFLGCLPRPKGRRQDAFGILDSSRGISRFQRRHNW